MVPLSKQPLRNPIETKTPATPVDLTHSLRRLHLQITHRRLLGRARWEQSYVHGSDIPESPYVLVKHKISGFSPKAATYPHPVKRDRKLCLTARYTYQYRRPALFGLFKK